MTLHKKGVFSGMDPHNFPVRQVEPRSDVEIHLPDGRVLSGPRGINVGAFFQNPGFASPIPIMGAVVNGELRELTYPIQMDSKVSPVSMADADGSRIYRRSLTFLLSAIFERMYPDRVLGVDHSVASGGFFCKVDHGLPLTVEQVAALEHEMQRTVAQNLPFERQEVPLKDAQDYFVHKGQQDKVRLMSYRTKPYLVLYSLQEYKDYHHGYMVPSTGYLKWFKLIPILPEGFILQYPRRHVPTELQELPEAIKLLDTFRQYGNWLQNLGIESVGALNDAIQEKRIREVVLISEALHEQNIAQIAQRIADESKRARVILIAGPSSSGKTTFSKRLTVQLLAQGISPVPIELDNYFVDRELTPKDETGQFDFEALSALNTRLLTQQLQALIAGEEVVLPKYNFRSGLSETGESLRLVRDQIIILEGIQGLNPQLIPQIPADQTRRIYISALTQLNLDRYNRISTTDTRLLRRIVRDARERGYSAQQTIQRWESVRRGEKRYIFPYQENADDLFNSALVYELSALKVLAEPLLRQVPYGTPEHIEAKRLLAFLEWFLPVEEKLIPDNSILREFVGNSILKDFKIWHSSSEISA